METIWRQESARIVAGVARIVGDVGLAEELAQDALVAALEQWPESGVPDNPGAWLMTVAKRRAIDHVRRTRRQEHGQEELARRTQPEPDDVLRLMFVSAHPVLPTEERVALTLRLLGGLTTEEIARAFLITDQQVSQRIAAAKRRLATVGFVAPEGTERLASVLEVVYLIFNEGYSATSGTDLTRPALADEALRLGRLLADLAPREPEVHGLLALMEIQSSRTAARTGPDGAPVPLRDQDRTLWDPDGVRRGFTAMLRARALGGPPGPYLLQAAIATVHAQAGTAEETDWAQLAALYDALVELLPTPVVRLNRAVAVGYARGPQAGLDLADTLLTDPALRDYHLLPGVRGDLLARLGRRAEARTEFERAAVLTANAAERAFLLRRARETAAPSGPDLGPASTPSGSGAELGTLGQAADAFLARDDLDSQTLRSYGQTLRRLRRSLGDRVPVRALTAEQIAQVFTTTWGQAAASTWNRHRAAVRSFAAWAAWAAGNVLTADPVIGPTAVPPIDLAAGLERRAEARTPAAALPRPRLDVLWGGPDVALRERVLWRVLHESQSPVRTILSLDLEDLDERRTGAPRHAASWRDDTAALLRELVGDRTSGPVFLSERRPAPARTPASTDLCPLTGRRRLSYERAEYLFKRASGGHTLRLLRTRTR
ncbi:sigma-70 family RNA polymerase sigma factor [Nonomuraea longicatena]|uniref:RNA polymerase sigma factor n=1 Tax=Nonomuraea longicatena TaxID=83682 RepID=A0ABP4B8G5_9ACTN